MQLDLFAYSAAADRRGVAPPIKGRCAAGTGGTRSTPPQRLQRTRRRNRKTPPGAVYVGRPTIWLNPFAGRYRIGHKRSVILFKAWLRGDCSPRVLKAAGFSKAEAAELERRRLRVLQRLPQLAGRDLQCWCPTTSEWCHADVLIQLAGGAPSYA